VTVDLSKVGLFLRALVYSLAENEDLRILLDNITGGNVRDALRLVRQFMGSPNVNVRKILEIMHQTGSYYIALHEFTKSVILGDYTHYYPEGSDIANVFDVSTPNAREHFLAPLILAYVGWNGAPRDGDGFVLTSEIVEEMQWRGFTAEQSDLGLVRLVGKKLLEPVGRAGVSGESNEALPISFRPTTAGAYHVERLAGSFIYLDCMLFDTPIFDPRLREDIAKRARSFAIEDRLYRCVKFRQYLSEIWAESGMRPSYFDWNRVAEIGERDFGNVLAFIAKQDLARRTRKEEGG
jgi:hypothetical protein